MIIIGNIYVADSVNNRIRKVVSSTSIISTIAGTGMGGYSGDNGLATSAALNYPVGVAMDASGKCFRLIFPCQKLNSCIYRQYIQQ